WLATTRATQWARVLLPVLAVLALAPNVGLAAWAGPGTRTLFSRSAPTIPALFTGDTYKRYLRRDDVVLALPFGARGNALILQAKSGFWFRLADGYIWNTVPESFMRTRQVAVMATNEPPPQVHYRDLRAFARHASATVIVVHTHHNRRWHRMLRRLGTPQAV